jgi:hypothetical protein
VFPSSRPSHRFGSLVFVLDLEVGLVVVDHVEEDSAAEGDQPALGHRQN